MQKWVLSLVIGGLVTWFLWKTQRLWAYIAGVITLLATYYFYKKG